MISVFISVSITFFNGSSDMWEFGNKYITLFFNENCALSLCVPFVVFAANSSFSLHYIKKSAVLAGLTSIILYILGANYRLLTYLNTVAFLPIFYYYLSKDKRIIVFGCTLLAIVSAIISDRSQFLFVVFSWTAFFLAYFVKKDVLIRLFNIFCILSPFFIFIPLFTLSHYKDSTMFHDLLVYITDASANDDLGLDTRTFLYYELYQDLSLNDSWLFGKGAYSHYFSEFFLKSISGEGDNAVRITSEVAFLGQLQKGGLLYVFLYYALFLMGIYKSTKANNQFMKAVSMILASFFIHNFITGMLSFSFYYIGVYFLLGCALITKLNECSDEEIEGYIDPDIYPYIIDNYDYKR